MIPLRLTIKGFIVSDYGDMMPDFHARHGRVGESRQTQMAETIVDGIENAPRAFIGLFRGDNMGKMLVRVGPDKAV